MEPRVLTLEGGHNFREVGGYPSSAGASLRRGLVWRSAGLDRLTLQDCLAVRTLGLRAIADLRTDAERDQFPTPAALTEAVRLLVWPNPASATGWTPEVGQAWSKLSLDELRGEISRLYTRIAETHARQLSDLYQSIADGGGPILIHCTAGKDRTGIAVAILLELVGVPRGWVVWDYEQTNRYLKKHMVNVESVAAVGATAKWLDTLGPEGRDLVLGVDRSYLLTALKDLDQRFGSIEAFARVGLGLSVETLDELRRTLLGSD